MERSGAVVAIVRVVRYFSERRRVVLRAWGRRKVRKRGRRVTMLGDASSA